MDGGSNPPASTRWTCARREPSVYLIRESRPRGPEFHASLFALDASRMVAWRPHTWRDPGTANL